MDGAELKRLELVLLQGVTARFLFRKIVFNFVLKILRSLVFILRVL